MSKTQVAWTLREVVAVHLLRLLVGFGLVKLVYPAWLVASQPAVEITDRVVMVILVWAAMRRHGSFLATWNTLGLKQPYDCLIGIAAGAVLLGVSLLSEKLYTTIFYWDVASHPLIVQVTQAESWQALVIPLFLAGALAPVAEEILYRLFTFRALEARFGLAGGAVMSAAIFALFHFNAYWLAELMVVGIGLALLYSWTGSLASAIIAHSVINTAKMMLVYFHVI